MRLTVTARFTAAALLLACLPGSAQTIRTAAGAGPVSGQSYTATAMSVYSPNAVATDSAGNLYIAGLGLDQIYKVTPSGQLSLYAGNGNINGDNGDGGPALQAEIDPSGVNLATDAAGDLFFPDAYNCVVRKIAANGTISTVAGVKGGCGYGGDGGAATSAELNYPYAVAVDAGGDLYIADYGNAAVREVSATTGLISTVAGNGVSHSLAAGSPVSGPPASLAIGQIYGIALDGSGNLYFQDFTNRVIWEVNAQTGNMAVVAGQIAHSATVCASASDAEGDGCPATQAVLSPEITAFTVDAAGDMYVADEGATGTGASIREISGGNIELIAGSETAVALGNHGPLVNVGDGGPLTAALFSHIDCLYAAADGSVYAADSSGDRVRRIAGGQISTIAGNGFALYSGDGGPALSAHIQVPNGIALDATGDLLTADANSLRKISPMAAGTPTIQTVTGTGAAGAFTTEGGPALGASTNNLYGVVTDAAGDIIYVDAGNNAIREISAATGDTTTLVGGGTAGYNGDGVPAATAEINGPRYLALDAAGNIYFGDNLNNRIREITIADGLIHTVVGTGTKGYSGDGGLATSAEINVPSGIAFDTAGDMFFADTGNHVVREVAVGTGMITTVVGDGTAGLTGVGGPATAAEISYPLGLAVDAAGDLFIGDQLNGTVFEVVKSSGLLTVLTGNGSQIGEDFSGAAADAGGIDPTAIVMDAQGNLFFGDEDNEVIREIMTQPAATLSATTLSFGNQALGTSSSSQSVTLTNSGGTTLTFTGISLSGANYADFSASNNCGASLAPGAECAIQVSFAPTDSGARAASLVISDNVAGSPQSVALSGTGVAAAASFSPASLTFAAQSLGTTSAAQTLTLTNSGGAALAITAIGASGAFTETNNCGATVAAGASCAIAVSFTPTAAGAASGAVSVTDNAPNSPQSVALSGAGVALAQIVLSQSSLSFASQAVGTASGSQSIVVSNTGAVAASLSGIAATGDFTVSSGCGPSLAAGAQCTVSVAFVPTALGARTGTLTITDNAANSPQQVALSGTGVGAGVALAPSSLNFGSQPVGVASSPLNFTVTNTSADVLTISAASASAGFAVSGACPSVQAGASCSFGITFTPTAVGAVSGTLTLTDNAGAQTVPLQGLGTAAGITLSPSSLSFGNTLVGGSSFAQQVTLANTGNAALAAITLPTQAGDFLVANTGASACAATLAAGASCSFSVTLAPTVTGADTATLGITDSLGTQTVALAGVGIAPGASLSTTQLSFGSQTVGTTSGAQTVTLTNSGTAALAITALTASNPAFTENDNCVGSVATGASCSVNISFSPTAAGAATGTLTIGDSTGGQSIALSGSGVLGLSLSPAYLTFGAQELGGVSPQQTINITDTGVTPVYLSTFAASGDFQVSQNLCNAALQPGQSCQVFVTYTPSALGTSLGSLTLADAGAVNSVTADFSGTGTRPGIAASPAALAFGGATVGTAAQQQTVTVSNNGTASLNIQALTANGDFAVSGSTCLGSGGAAQALAPGATCIVSVTMTPTSLGTRTGTLNVFNDADGSLSLALTGTGQGAGVTVSPTQLAFGSQPVPGAGNVTLTPVPQTVSITNNGTAPLLLSSLAVSGGFSQSNNCGGTLAAGASCTVSVAFNPTALGQWTGTLTINDNSSTGSPQLVTLNGFGSPNGLSLSPAVFNFGGLTVGITSAPATSTLSNGTGQAINDLAINASGGFHQTNTCTSPLAAGATCAITVTVTPSLNGNINGSVSINGALASGGSGPGADPARAIAIARALSHPGVDSSALNLAELAVSGNGNPAALSLSVANLTFASQAVGAASAAQAVTVTNSSTATAVSGLTVTSTPDFPITTTCTASLAPAATCTVSVVFQAVAAGARTGNLTISGSGGLQSTVALSGTATGGTLTALPSALDFGARPEGTASAAQVVTLQNTGGASFALQSFSSSNPDFTVAATSCGALPATLAANATCTVSVVFEPSTTAAESATLTIGSTASNGNAVVGLSGSGNTQGLTLTPVSLSFGNQGVGVPSAAQTVTLANPGTAAVAISAIAAGGDFSQTNNCGASLAAGASCAVQVIFTPSATGARTGSLTVTDAAATQVAALSGTGGVFAFAAASGTQTVTAGGTAQFQVALTPGTFAGTVTLACSGAPANATCSIAPASATLVAGAAATTATVTVTTTARALLPPLPLAPTAPPSAPLAWWLLALAGAVLLLSTVAAGSRRRGRRLLLALTGAALLAAGCGGVSNLPTAGGGTPAGVYPMTITATSGASVQTVTVTLEVN